MIRFLVCPIALGVVTSSCLLAQDAKVFSRADSLRGGLTVFRTCYDVQYYHLDVRIDPESKTIKGSTSIQFTATESFHTLQIDLFPNMNIEKIELGDGNPVRFEREHGAVFVHFTSEVRKGDRKTLKIDYNGAPVSAERPPWSGGFIWTKDTEGNPWIAVACQGDGASLWWPNKDHQSDEPDSMLISITVPPDLMDVSNGRLRGVTTQADGWKKYDWFVSNPINNYNVTVNIGKYKHFSDVYTRDDRSLTLDYYVMPPNLQKATKQFTQVKTMLASFEKYFGEYPFAKDGFKLVEVPYLGMEHQSAIAYGNKYMNGYAGTAQSAVGPASRVGLEFDFIIIHEAAHEWWGNSVTSKDIADMWIHEGFGAYAEALYVEDQWGYDAAIDYINAKKVSVANDRPIIGAYEVQNAGSKDMYNKGQLVLNTVRSILSDDALWFSIVKGLATQFRMQTITSDDVFRYINERAGRDLTPVFDQYFRSTRIPGLEVMITWKDDESTMKYRWTGVVDKFAMPVKVTLSEGEFGMIHPTTDWQTMKLGNMDPRAFRMADNLFYATLNLQWAYLDPAKDDAEFLRK